RRLQGGCGRERARAMMRTDISDLATGAKLCCCTVELFAINKYSSLLNRLIDTISPRLSVVVSVQWECMIVIVYKGRHCKDIAPDNRTKLLTLASRVQYQISSYLIE